jgi:hypothetical protein
LVQAAGPQRKLPEFGQGYLLPDHRLLVELPGAPHEKAGAITPGKRHFDADSGPRATTRQRRLVTAAGAVASPVSSIISSALRERILSSPIIFKPQRRKK